MSELVECVPNFSEGRNLSVVRAIVAEISSDRSVRLLDQEMNADHNRCVVTFAGEAQAVVEAALKGVRKATELIDLRRHRGEHPRMGATDVLPFVPIGPTKLERAVGLAGRVARRIAKASRLRRGGVRYVKAVGFELKERGIVQISMNLVNTLGTPVQRVFALVEDEADRYGGPIVGSEVVGLICQVALIDVAE